MYPDIINAFKKMGYRPDQYDYLMARMPKGAPIAQKITQKWIDEVSQWLQSKGMVPSVSAIAALAGMHEATRNR